MAKKIREYFSRIFGKEEEKEEVKSEIDVLIDFLKNTANLTYVPDLYRDNLEKALLLIKNEESNYVLRQERNKFSEIKNAAKYAIERVGFRIQIVDDKGYKGKVGVSPVLKRLYNLTRGEGIRVRFLDLTSVVEENLEALTLKMYKEDAAMLFGTKRVEEATAKGGIIEPVKIELSVIPIFPLEEERKTIAAQIEEDLKPYMETYTELFPPKEETKPDEKGL
jgi:hypothetical protein